MEILIRTLRREPMQESSARLVMASQLWLYYSTATMKSMKVDFYVKSANSTSTYFGLVGHLREG